MTQLEQQMIDELVVAQGFTNDLAANLTTQGVAASNTEGLDTLVPKVLQIDGGGGVAYDYERVNVAPTIALKLATQTAIIETLTSANTFAITLPTPRLNKVNESIITFKIGSTVPNITLPANLKWHTDKVVLAPMTTRTIVFEQLTFDGINYEVWASCDKQ
jgi:hypothetical protein